MTQNHNKENYFSVMTPENKDTKYKKYIGEYLVELDHALPMIKILYQGELVKAYDCTIHDMHERLEQYVKYVQSVVDKKKNG